MELSISHSSLRPSAVLPQRCKSSSHNNRMICIKPITKNMNNCSSNLPSKLCSTNRLIQPLAGLYGESKQDRPRNIIHVCMYMCVCVCVCVWMLQFALHHEKTKKNFMYASIYRYTYMVFSLFVFALHPQKDNFFFLQPLLCHMFIFQ